VLATAATLACVVLTLAGLPSTAGAGTVCAGSVSAGSHHGIYLHAFALRPTDVSCRAAKTVVRAFFRAKLNPNEICAGRAVNPPFVGCRVDGYLCRATATLTRSETSIPDLCSDGRRRVAFRESDSDHG
jgi:hypothetical protein